MRKARVVPLLLLLALLASCATAGPASTPPLTPLQTAKLSAIAFLETYKTQFTDAQAMGKMAASGQLPAGQLEVYRTKRALLIKAKDLIDIYAGMVEIGTVPSDDQTQAINNVLNQLVSVAGGAK